MFYTIGLNSDLPSVNLIKRLHEKSIQTIVISSKLTSSVFSHDPKNMIFFVNDVDVLLKLIFYSISDQRTFDLNGENSTGPQRDHIGGEFSSENIYSNHCIRVDGHFIGGKEGKTCSKTFGISSAELEDDSTLSDSVVNATHGLYVNNIWNSKNYLVFFLKEFQQNLDKSKSKHLENSNHLRLIGEGDQNREIDPFDSMLFCFKFFWRFFKGRKAIICHPQGCEKYDPFTNKLISFDNENDDTFFDFSLKNMNARPLKVYIDYIYTPNLTVLNPATFDRWISFHKTAVELLANSLNCRLNYASVLYSVEIWREDFAKKASLKYDIDLYLFGNGVAVGKPDRSTFDFLESVETSALCIATPHSDFMSQGLVIFKSFTPIVWALTIMTIFGFSCTQYVFQYSQIEIFKRLYSEAQRDHLRDTSSVLTISAYFFCGSPPSLNLGHLRTGKILFLIFSFSSLIISTAFLSSMTTLLSNRVLYPEIDSLKTLEESDLLIETLNSRETDTNLFAEKNLMLSDPLKEKLVNSYVFYYDERYSRSFLDGNWTTNEGAEIEDSIYARQYLNVRKSGILSDAFLVSLPSMLNPRENVLIQHFLPKQTLEYHLVKECLMHCPLEMPVLKNSLVYDELNQIIAHLLEAGLARRIMDNTSDDSVRWGNSSAMEDGSEPRAYDINDLQSAFIGLSIGKHSKP
ncbi:unnamed protein product [Bemisia tabaci]|uniref:Ionotropic glutamate receptor C-terminal domain-containing protein n=1 Tax=Bemisia tabaci TaxID=7038 RepID=A0A9P0F0C6_BEMTA|nr:unnamed protein product [Bemisia tabaci]